MLLKWPGGKTRNIFSSTKYFKILKTFPKFTFVWFGQVLSALRVKVNTNDTHIHIEEKYLSFNSHKKIRNSKQLWIIPNKKMQKKRLKICIYVEKWGKYDHIIKWAQVGLTRWKMVEINFGIPLHPKKVHKNCLKWRENWSKTIFGFVAPPPPKKRNK